MIICLIISAIFVVLGILNFCQKIPMHNFYYIIQVKEKKAKMDKKMLYTHTGIGDILLALTFLLLAFCFKFDMPYWFYTLMVMSLFSSIPFFVGRVYYETKKYNNNVNKN